MTSIYSDGLIRQGDDSIAVVKNGDIVHRLQSFEKYQEVIFHNLEANTPKTFNLSDFIDSDYHVHAYEFDLKFDNDNPDDLVTVSDNNYAVQIEIRRIVDGVEKSRIQYGAGLGRMQFGFTFLRQNEQIRLTTTVDCTSVTMFCVPCLLAKPINLFTN